MKLKEKNEKLNYYHLGNKEELEGAINKLIEDISKIKEKIKDLNKENKKLKTFLAEDDSQEFISYMLKNYEIKRVVEHFNNITIRDAELIESSLTDLKDYFILPENKLELLDEIENYLINNDINAKFILIRSGESIKSSYKIEEITERNVKSSIFNKFIIFNKKESPKYFGIEARNKIIELNNSEILKLNSVKNKKLGLKKELNSILDEIKALEHNIKTNFDNIKKSQQNQDETAFINDLELKIRNSKEEDLQLNQKLKEMENVEENLPDILKEYNNELKEKSAKMKEIENETNSSISLRRELKIGLKNKLNELNIVKIINTQQNKLSNLIITAIKELFGNRKQTRDFIHELNNKNDIISNKIIEFVSDTFSRLEHSLRDIRRRIIKSLKDYLKEYSQKTAELEINYRKNDELKKLKKNQIEMNEKLINNLVKRKLIEEVRILNNYDDAISYLNLCRIEIYKSIETEIKKTPIKNFGITRVKITNNYLKNEKILLEVLNKLQNDFKYAAKHICDKIKDYYIGKITLRFNITKGIGVFTDRDNYLSFKTIKNEALFDLDKIKIHKYYLKQLADLKNKIKKISEESANQCYLFIDLITQQLRQFKRISESFNLIAQIADFGELGQIEFSFTQNIFYSNLIKLKNSLKEAELKGELPNLIQDIITNNKNLLRYFSLQVFKDKYVNVSQFLDYYQYFEFNIYNIRYDGVKKTALKCSGGEDLGLRFLIYALIFHILRQNPNRPPHDGDIIMYFDEFAALDPKGLNSVIKISKKLNIFSLLAAVKAPNLYDSNIHFYHIQNGIIKKNESSIIAQWQYVGDNDIQIS